MKNQILSLQNLLYFITIFFLISCNEPLERKLMVFYDGELEVFQNQLTNNTNILFHSKEIDLTGFKNVEAIEITKDGNKYTIPFPKEVGYYVLNISNDTIYGGRKPITETRIDSTDVAHVKSLVDSLQSLLDEKVSGKKNNNYVIYPEQLVQISDKPLYVRAFPPYKPLFGSIEGPEDGSEPEVYKFNAREEVLFEQESYRNIYTLIELQNNSKAE